MASSEPPVAIVGAGPTGIACAIELSRRGIGAVCYDKGFLLDTIYHFPEEMRWFSTRDLLDIAGVPFSTPDAHPTRLESLAYYRGVAEKFRVRVVPQTRVHEIRSHPPRRLLLSIEDRTGRREITAPAAIFATGFFGNPRRLDVREKTYRTSTGALFRPILFTTATWSSSARRTRRPKPRSISTATAPASPSWLEATRSPTV